MLFYRPYHQRHHAQSADRIECKAVFIATVINFSMATGILAFTPDNGWVFP